MKSYLLYICGHCGHYQRHTRTLYIHCTTNVNHASRLGENYTNKITNIGHNPTSLWPLCYCDAHSVVHVNENYLQHYATVSIAMLTIYTVAVYEAQPRTTTRGPLPQNAYRTISEALWVETVQKAESYDITCSHMVTLQQGFVTVFP